MLKVEHAASRAPDRGRLGHRREKLWPVIALLPIIVVGQIKATGFGTVLGVDATALCVVLLLSVTGASWIHNRQYPLRKMLPFMLFALVVLAGVAASDPGTYQGTKARDFFFLTGVVVACVPVLVRSIADLGGLVLVWLVGGLIVAGMVLVVGGAEDLNGRAGIGEFTLGPAYLSAVAVVTAAALLGERYIPIALSASSLLVSGVALVAIGSRGPVIAAVAGFLSWALLRGVYRLRTLLAVIATVVVAVIAVNHASDAALSRFVLQDPERRALWQSARSAFSGSPFLGLGWGDFSTHSLIASYPHNLVLETASELGLLGIAALLTLLICALARVWRARSVPEVRILFAVMVTLLVGQQFSADLTNRLLWVAIIPCLLLPLPSVECLQPHAQAGRTAGDGMPRLLLARHRGRI